MPKPKQLSRSRAKAAPSLLREETSVRRLRAKLEAAQLKAALSYYAAADKGRRNKDWKAPASSADLAIIPDAQLALARARTTVANTWIGKAASRSQKRNVVGRGIMVVPVAKDAGGDELPDINKKAASDFLRWASNKSACDVERRRTFWQIQRTAVTEEFVAGESIIVWSYVPNSRTVGLRLQMFEPEQLDRTITSWQGNEVRGGVEVDEFGAAVAYHLYQRNPADYLSTRQSLYSARVPAERVFHYFDAERVLQTRGMTQMAPVLPDVRDFASFKDATLWRARMEACIGFLIKKNLPTVSGGVPGIGPLAPGDTGTTASGMRTIDLVPGMTPELMPGEDVVPFVPSAPGNQYDPFTTVTLRGIGAGMGMSFGALTRHNDANYSAARQDMLEDEREIGPQQDSLIDTLILPVYELWFRFAVLEGRLPVDQDEFLADPERFMDAEYIPPARPWIDPEKEANAYEKALKLRIITRKEIVAMRGGRFQNILDQLEQERKEADEHGIQFPEDVEAQALLAKSEAAVVKADATAAGGATYPVDGQLPGGATGNGESNGDDGDNAASLGWITINGTHVEVNDNGSDSGQIEKGPPDLKGEKAAGPQKVFSKRDIKDVRKTGGKIGVHQANELLPVGQTIEYSNAEGKYTLKVTGHEDAGKDEFGNKRVLPRFEIVESPKGENRLTGKPTLADVANDAHADDKASRRKLAVAIDAPDYRPMEAPETSCSTCSNAVGMYCKAYDFNFTPGFVCDSWAAEPPNPSADGRKGMLPQHPDGDPPLDTQSARDGLAAAAPALSSTQLNIPVPLRDEILRFGESLVPVEHLDPVNGRESQPHVTVLFGLHTRSPSAVYKIAADTPPIELTIGNVGYFEGTGYDVVYLAVDGPELRKLRDALLALDHTLTYDNYRPHVTLAYVERGFAAQYDGRADMAGRTVTVRALTFSPAKNKPDVTIELTGKPG